MKTLIIIIFIISIFNFLICLTSFIYSLSKLISIYKLKNKLNKEIKELLNETESDLFELQ